MPITIYKNTPLFYADFSGGNAIVLLHGFLENSSIWNNFIDALSENHRVVTIDLLGHGQSGCLSYVHSMEDQADAVYAVLEELHIGKAIIAGHSMGGYVALAFAELYPQMTSRLALINSTSKADNSERKHNRDRAMAAAKKDKISFVRLSIANLFSEKNRERLSDEIELLKNEAQKAPIQGIIAALEGMKIRADREMILHTADYPILLILGESDPVLPYMENSDQAQYNSVTLKTFDGGHISPIENREELLDELLDLLNH